MKKHFFKNLPVHWKMMVTLLGMTAVCAVGLLAYYYEVSTRIIVPNAKRQIINTMNQAARNLDAKISAIESILYDTSTNARLQELLLTAERIEEDDELSFWSLSEKICEIVMMENTKQSAIRGFYIFDTKGRPYVVKSYQYDFNTQNIRWEELEEAKGKTVWGRPEYARLRYGRDQEMTVIPLGKAVYSIATQRQLGYIVAYLDADYLQSVVEDLAFGENDVIFLTDKRGNTLPIDMKNEAVNMPFLDGQIVSADYEGNRSRIAAWPLEEGIWKICVITKDKASSPELIILRTTTIILLLCTGALTILISALLTRNISKLVLGLVQDIYDEKLLSQQAQLRMLQMQINPHFLYNTLDTINWLAQLHGAQDVAEVSRSLAYLMRFSLTEEELVPLEEEIDAAEHYMLIQKYRYGEQLKFLIEVDEDALYEKVPCHSILPLIENAVEHGLKNKPNHKQVEINGWLEDGNINIKIRDNGAGMTPEKIKEILQGMAGGPQDKDRKHVPIGLRNVDRRIRLRYGEEYALRIDSTLGEGTVIWLRIPCQQEAGTEIQEEEQEKTYE